MRAAIRNRLVQLHAWTGLSAGLVVVFLAVTGAGFVLRPRLDSMLSRKLLVVPECSARLPLDAIAARAQRAHPRARIRSVEVTDDVTASTAVLFTDRDYVYVDPCTGVVLGTRNEYGGFFGTLEGLHRFSFLSWGKLLAGWSAAGFALLLVVGGLVLWWPRTRLALTSALKFKRRLTGTARTLSLHKVVGVYTALVLIVVSLTGVAIAFAPVQSAIYWAAGGPPDKSRSAPAHPGQKPLAMEVLWQRARLVVPNQEWVAIHYPQTPAESVYFEIRERGMPHEDAKSYAFLDAYTGATLRTIRYRTGITAGRKIYLYMIALHQGLIGGLLWQILLLVAALSLPVQAYSGISLWLRRKLAPRSTIEVRVAAIERETPEVKTFSLVPVRGRLPAFEPGAHIAIKLDEGLVRQYSLCGDPSDRSRYLIAVKRASDSRGGSAAMHERVRVGDVISIAPPLNHFPLEPEAAHHLLVAAGIGITPLLSMARELQRTSASWRLEYFARSAAQAAFHGTLSRPEIRSRVAFHHEQTRECIRERLRELVRQRRGGAHLYLCGPRPFMDMARELAGVAGWPEEAIHTESFSADPAIEGARVPFDVTLARSGATCTVPANRTLLDVLAEKGIGEIGSCREGVCGSCLTGVLEGVLDHRDAFLSEAERRSNSKMLVCVSRAKTGRLVLDL